ncbi:MAG: DUF1573 domain-containing protein [Pirellulales bacterium]|nr:DUF1573 domain-containing protein [Pirellulales bacterium]
MKTWVRLSRIAGKLVQYVHWSFYRFFPPELMRHWVLIVLALLLGIALGFGGTIIELGASPSGTIAQDLAIGDTAVAVDSSAPHVIVENTEFDFGNMERGISQSHTFSVKNGGRGLLTLEKGPVSCGLCIIGVHFDNTPVPSDQTGEVAITWKANSMGPFRHHADVHTNDPSRPTVQFTIVGKVMNSFRVSPEELVFSGVSATNSATAELRIYSYRSKQVAVTGHKFTVDESADKFEVRAEPLSTKQLHEDPEAKGGVAVFVSTKPGLPVGRLTQKLELTLDLPNNPVVDVPITGMVVSDVQMIGGNEWDSENGLLSLGTVSGRKGAKVEMKLQAHGPHAKDLHPVLKSAKPDLLKVTFGERRELAGGHFVQVPMTIEIPIGTRPAVHLGNKQGEMGEILIETGHPEANILRIPVRFTVGD